MAKELLFEKNRWQKVSGTNHGKLFPHIVKPDVVSPSSFVIETANQLILIDPGGLKAQWEYLVDIIKPIIIAKNLPLLICLSHSHVDHCLTVGMSKELKEITDVKVAIHEVGAKVLSSGDTKLSLADLYGYSFPPFNPDLLLFSQRGKNNSQESHLEYGFRNDNLTKKAGRMFQKESIEVGGGDVFEIYHTPGHSQDSVCFRFGSMLFVSDILSAANPMVAGITGWNRQDYMDSIQNLIWLLDSSSIEFCFPGHGYPMKTTDIKKRMIRIRDDIKVLGKLREVNRDSLLYAKEYAIDLLEEVGDVFTIIAGRLYALSYHLDELEESKEAYKYRNLLDADKIEYLILNFKAIVDKVNGGKLLELHLVFEAAESVWKIMRLFDLKKYDGIINKSYLRRASSMLMDFLTVIRGVDYVTNNEDIILNDFIDVFLKDINTCLYEDKSIINLVGNENDYLKTLASRIAHIPILRDVHIEFSPGNVVKPVSLDIQRFKDAFNGLLEQIAVSHVKKICISTHTDENGVCIEVVTDCSAIDIIVERKFRMHVRRFEVCGIILSQIKNVKKQGFYLSFVHRDI